MSIERIRKLIDEQIKAHERLEGESAAILKVAEQITACLRAGGRVLLFGNGGSAADAQHVAAELVGRFTRERNAWPAIALTTNTSILTAIGNDYGFDRIFSRQVEALAGDHDVVVGISTSGNSPNVIAGLRAGHSQGAVTIGFTGGTGGSLAEHCDLCFIAPASETARIQELHISAWHIICDIVEEDLS